MIGIWSLGMGITDRKTIELGLGFLKFGKAIGWEMGFGQNLGWENGIYTPPSGPSYINCVFTPIFTFKVCIIAMINHDFSLCSLALRALRKRQSRENDRRSRVHAPPPSYADKNLRTMYIKGLVALNYQFLVEFLAKRVFFWSLS